MISAYVLWRQQDNFLIQQQKPHEGFGNVTLVKIEGQMYREKRAQRKGEEEQK